MKEYLNELNQLVSAAETDPADIIVQKGKLAEEITDSVKKYHYLGNAFSHFIVFSDFGLINEISFTLKKPEIYDNELVDCFGNPKINYSFRDNLTEFRFTRVNRPVDLVLLMDNKIEPQDDRSFLETKPKGETLLHKHLPLECISLIVKN